MLKRDIRYTKRTSSLWHRWATFYRPWGRFSERTRKAFQHNGWVAEMLDTDLY